MVRGKESKTYRFVFISWLVVTVKFAVAGITIDAIGSMPAMGVGEYGAAIALILAIWLGREYTEKVSQNVTK